MVLMCTGATIEGGAMAIDLLSIVDRFHSAKVTTVGFACRAFSI